MAVDSANILDKARGQMDGYFERGRSAREFVGLTRLFPAVRSECPVYACACRMNSDKSLGALLLTETTLYYGSYMYMGSYNLERPIREMRLVDVSRDPTCTWQRPFFRSLSLGTGEGEMVFDLMRASGAKTIQKALTFLRAHPPILRRFFVGADSTEPVTLRIGPGENRIAWTFDTPKARGAMISDKAARDRFIAEYNMLASERGLSTLDEWGFGTAVAPTYLFPGT
jgi:hypothetical protein